MANKGMYIELNLTVAGGSEIFKAKKEWINTDMEQVLLVEKILKDGFGMALEGQMQKKVE